MPFAGDVEAIEKDFSVRGFIKRIGSDSADGDIMEAQFGEGFLKPTDDTNGLLNSRSENFSVAENVESQWDILFEEVDSFLGAVLANAEDDHRSVAGSDVNGGTEYFGRRIRHGDKSNRLERGGLRQ